MNVDPKLIIIGAQKAGTTSLYRYLSQHPGARGHEAREYAFYLDNREWKKGPSEAAMKYFADIAPGEVPIAKNAMLLYSEKGVQRLLASAPETEIVVVLRDPVDRARSAFDYARLRGWEPARTFEEALDLEEARLARDPYRWRHCAYVSNGRYIDHLEPLGNLFRSGKLHVVLTDELRQESQRICVELWESIGLPYHPLANSDRYNERAAPRSTSAARLLAWALGDTGSRNPMTKVAGAMLRLLPGDAGYRLFRRVRYGLLRLNEKPASAQSKDPAVVERLSASFREPNHRLAELIQRDLSHWTGMP